jgi:hypothetical protein
MSTTRLTAVPAASPPICADRIEIAPVCFCSVTTHRHGPRPAPAIMF